MTIDLKTASIDRLIDWIRRKRRQNPGRPLSELLKREGIATEPCDEQRLVDLACIDLIERWRLGVAAQTEEYIADFSVLRNESYLLDLIDAELCVANELGETASANSLTNRFPDLADQIRDMLLLQPTKESMDRSSLGRRRNEIVRRSGGFDDQTDFSVGDSRQTQTSLSAAIEAVHPIDLPEWFVPECCFASSPRARLIRGRDSQRGTAMALKILELPTTLTPAQSELILDSCELAARVRNGHWVSPTIAVIKNRHLGILRPWVFGRPWDTHSSLVDRSSVSDSQNQLRRLASVAYSIAAAHQKGAVHGGVHVNNLVIDHDGSVKLIDATSSQRGLSRWIQANDAATPMFATLAQIDVQEFANLVNSSCIEWNTPWSRDLANETVRTMQTVVDDVLCIMGDRLTRQADSIQKSNPSKQENSIPVGFRDRLSRLLSSLARSVYD